MGTGKPPRPTSSSPPVARLPPYARTALVTSASAFSLDGSLASGGDLRDAAAFDALLVRLGGLRPHGRGARGPCPICDSRTGCWARVHEDGSVRVGCFACGDWKSLRALAGLDGSTPLRFLPRPPSAHAARAPKMVEDADLLDAVYRVLLDALPMPADERRNVLGRARGIPADVRERMGALMGPVPADAGEWAQRRRKLVDDLRAVASYEFLVRVPEFARRANHSLAVLHTRTEAKYFEPWRDEEGRIVALRAYMGKQTEGPKYLATGGRTGPLAHFAFGVDRAQAATSRWVLTEGWMKAEVAAHALGVVAVGFPGATTKQSWARALEVIQRTAPAAPVSIAFDADAWTTNPDIAVAALELAYLVEEVTGRPAEFAVWDTRIDADGSVTPKGLDDAIAAGVEVRFVDRAGFGAFLGLALDAWEYADAA